MDSPKENYAPLSSSIMNYYKKFGQNRNLEGYFRTEHNRSHLEPVDGEHIHHHHHNHHRNHKNSNLHGSGYKSTSEGSLYCPATSENLPNNDEPFSLGQSLQNISTLKNYLSNEKLNSTGDISFKNSARSGYKSDHDGAGGDTDNEVDGIKTTITSKEISKSKKGVNLNFESFIEINMPDNNNKFSTPITYPPLPPPSIPPITSELPTITKHCMSSEKMVQTYDDKEIQIEMPIIPTKSQLSNPQPQSLESELNISPTSSIASQQKQKLEWDSMADVGYSKRQLNTETNLNTLEQNALKKFFASYGLNSDPSIILLSSKKTSEKNEIKNDQIDEIKKTEIRMKWKDLSARILKEIDDKKLKSIPQSITTQTDNENVIVEKRFEKFCQTSFIEFKSQSVQVSEHSISSKNSKKIHSTISSNSMESNVEPSLQPTLNDNSLGKFENEEISKTSHPKSKSNPEEETDAESFEFLSGIDYMKKSDLSKKSSMVSSSSSGFDFGELDKIPVFQKLSKLEKNLTIGVNLINSLLESKSLSTDSKTVLIKKITTKLENYIKKNGETGAEELLTKHLKSHQKKIESVPSRELSHPPSSNQQSLKSSKSSAKDSPKKSSKSSTHSIPKQNNEWLQPMTNSELEYELYTKPKKTSESHGSEKSEKLIVKETKDEKEKDMQLSLIEANIKYLEKLKFFLERGGQVDNLMGKYDQIILKFR